MSYDGMKPCTQAPSRITWHYWIHLLRLLISLAWGLMLTAQLAPYYRSISPLAFLNPMSYLFVSINDILMLTLDFHRTDSYIGTVVAQTVASVFLLVPPATSIGLETTGNYSRIFWFKKYNSLYPRTNFVLNPFHILCTLYLSISLLWYKHGAGVNALWKSNAKDVLLGSSSTQSHPSWFGHARNPRLRRRDVSRILYFWTVYVPKILFRRVSPVESKRYAFFQNFCALLFMVAIIVRAGMALAQAQNQIETRSGVGSCYDLPSIGNVRVLVRHQDTNGLVGSNTQTSQEYDVGAQVATEWTDQYRCTSEAQHASPFDWNWFQVFNCRFRNENDYLFRDATYAITIRSTNGTSLDAVRLPSIWFANFADTYQDTSALDQQGFMSSVVPWLVPPWQMAGGRHMEGIISTVERRFITSSVFRDIIASITPIYKQAHLLTITTTDKTPSPDNFTSTALLTPSRTPPLSYLRSPTEFLEEKDSFDSMRRPVCAFIEDYRSSTIFDAIGSIGGLLAILQGVHILLFGRPLFWGLAGAKLISPFGLFGTCYSRGFRRRLRDRYHRHPTNGQTDDPAETIRIHAFLRDFVIDLGPADVDNEEDIELGRSRELGRLYPQNNRDRPHEDGQHDTSDSTLLLPYPGVDHHGSQDHDASATTTESNREP